MYRTGQYGHDWPENYTDRQEYLPIVEVSSDSKEYSCKRVDNNEDRPCEDLVLKALAIVVPLTHLAAVHSHRAQTTESDTRLHLTLI